LSAAAHQRREFLTLAGAAAIAGLASRETVAQPAIGGTMYGLIGKVTVGPGQRDAFAAILLEGGQAMPGCLSYIIAADPADADALWITEVWDNQANHQASLSLPAVQAAITKGRPMIAGFSNRVETVPIGGIGIPRK
jgi:quinol monooxygenase YgiN